MKETLAIIAISLVLLILIAGLIGLFGETVWLWVRSHTVDKKRMAEYNQRQLQTEYDRRRKYQRQAAQRKVRVKQKQIKGFGRNYAKNNY